MYTDLIILSMRIFSEQRILIGETIIIAQLSHFYVSFRKQNLFVSSSRMIVSQHNSKYYGDKMQCGKGDQSIVDFPVEHFMFLLSISLMSMWTN